MTMNDPGSTPPLPPDTAPAPLPTPAGAAPGAMTAGLAPWAFPPGAIPIGATPPGGLPGRYPPLDYWPAPPPRVWPALVLPFLAVAAATVVATGAIIAAAAVNVGLGGMSDQAKFQAWVESYGATPGGFLVLVFPGQLAFLGAALVAALLSPVPLRRRLGLNRPSVPWWGLLLLVGATPVAGLCGDLLMTSLFDKPSEHLEMMTKLLGGRTGLGLALVTLSISVMPGFSEEMLFRGYTQRRLLQRWHPAAAVLVSSLCFAGAHLDPAHVVGVLPLGIWLGVMAWLTGSIWPSILCHTTNNATAVLLINLNPALATEPVTGRPLEVAIFGTSAVCLALSVWVMRRFRPPAEPDAPAPTPAAPMFMPAPPPPQPWNADSAGFGVRRG